MVPKTLADLVRLLSSIVVDCERATGAALAELAGRLLLVLLQWTEEQLSEIQGALGWALAFLPPAKAEVTP